MKITKQELQEIIREEATKFKTALKLKKELAVIQEQLDEVEAGGIYTPSETAGPKFKANFDTENAGTPNKPKPGDGPANFMKEEEVEECELTEELEAIEAELSSLGDEYSEEGELSNDDAFVDDDYSQEDINIDRGGNVDDNYIESDEFLDENLEEPIEGTSVAQHADEADVEDGHTKVDKLQESEEVSRMKKLAGLL